MYRGEKITLRPFEKRDLERYREWINDSEIASLIDRVLPVSEIEHEKWYSSLQENKNAVVFAIEVNQEAKYIGNIWLWDIDYRHRKAEVRIVIGEKESMGKGFGVEALELISWFAFEKLNLHKIYAYVLASNESLYEDWGDDFVHSLKGMYAIALWDDKNKKGILVRDRVGKKSLYYTLQNGILFFASEIKALLQIPGFKREVNLEALHYYLSYKNIPCPLSIFKGINQLPPAHVLIFKPGGDLKIEKYWSPCFTPIEDSAEEFWIEGMIEILKRSVKRRLISDVPVGFLLSGGVDSGLTTALAATLSSSKIKTFTLTYSEEAATPGKIQDMECARQISKIYDTEHYEEIIKVSHFDEEFPKIISHFDEPFAGVVSTYFLSRLIAKHVKVALCGDGADELFGSYLTHRIAFPIHNYLCFNETMDINWRKFHSFEENYLKEKAETEDWNWRYKFFVFKDEEKLLLYSGKLAEETKKFSTLKHLKQYFEDLTAKDPLNRILEVEFKFQLPDQLLTFGDRLSMAHSLEVRNHYLDYEFVSFAAKIPGELKINNGETKYILKKAALKFLPEEIVFRKKEGFIMPVNQWLFRNLEWYVRNTLSSERLKKHGFFNVSYVKRLLNEFYSGREEYANKILLLITFQVWYELYMD